MKEKEIGRYGGKKNGRKRQKKKKERYKNVKYLKHDASYTVCTTHHLDRFIWPLKALDFIHKQ
jgi:hypothetical protein